jgi:hypothetical protein
MACMLSDSEIESKAREIEMAKRNKIAEDIIKKFCIENEADREAILEAVFKGYIKFDNDGYNEDGGKWRIELDNDETGDTSEVELEKEPACKPPLSPAAQKKREERKREIENIKAGKVDQYLNKFEAGKIKEQARSHGIENTEFVKALLQGVDTASKTKNSDLDGEARKKIACELVISFARLESISEKMSEEDGNKFEGADLPVSDFEHFVGVYSRAQEGFDVEVCISDRIIGTGQ